jgi:hypothetical protein
MIDVETAAGANRANWFDRLAAILIGAIAVLAAILAISQTTYGQRQDRAQQQAARLAADISVRSSASQLANNFALGSLQNALVLGMQGTSRALAGLKANDAPSTAVGAAEQTASERLQQMLTDTAATTGGAPLDAYAAGLLRATTGQLQAEVVEQNAQVDLANDASSRSDNSVLGLSFLALAGVLTGLAAVLGSGRAGWGVLLLASGIVVAAGCMAALAFA